MNVFRSRGYSTLYVGARREEDLPSVDTWSGHSVVRVGSHFPLANGRRPVRYLLGILQFYWHLIAELRRRSVDVIHASDFEAALPCAVFALLQRIPFVYNIHDNLADRYQLPKPLRSLLRLSEALVVLVSDATLVPEEFRRAALPSWCRKKVHIVRNAPDYDPGFSDPRSLSRSNRFRFFYGGWIDHGRGLELLRTLVHTTERLSLEVAGEGDQDLITELRADERVRWMGFLEHSDVMARTRLSGIVPALYNPARPINRYAASNKIAESLGVGRPVLINSELAIAEVLRPYGCVIEVPYTEIPNIAHTIEELLRDTAAYEEMCRKARMAYEDLYCAGSVNNQTQSIVDSVLGASRWNR